MWHRANSFGKRTMKPMQIRKPEARRYRQIPVKLDALAVPLLVRFRLDPAASIAPGKLHEDGGA
jgi:hypothetical protein